MKYKILAPILLSLSLLLSSCGSSGSSGSSGGTGTVPGGSTEPFSLAEKEFVHHLFLTEYLWYEQVASNIDYSNFSTPQSLIDGLKVFPPDQWSVSVTAQQYEDAANQKTAGFGFAYTPNDFNIVLVRIGAPAYGKLFRGDKILEVNGEAANNTNITSAGQSDIYVMMNLQELP